MFQTDFILMVNSKISLTKYTLFTGIENDRFYYNGVVYT